MRSHFEGQDLMESGGHKPFTEYTGWLGRGMETARLEGLAIALPMPLILRSKANLDNYFPTKLSTPSPEIMKRVSETYPDNSNLKSSTLNTITAAKKLSDDIHLIILGSNIEELANKSKVVHLLSKVITCDNEKLKNFLPELSAPLISNLAENYSHILAPASTFGKNLLPRVSALLDITQISDVIDIVSNDTFVRPIYAGNAISQVQTNQKINLLTIRPVSYTHLTLPTKA